MIEYSKINCGSQPEMTNRWQTCFYAPVVKQLALHNMPLRNSHSSQNSGEEPIFMFLILKYDQK